MPRAALLRQLQRRLAVAVSGFLPLVGKAEGGINTTLREDAAGTSRLMAFFPVGGNLPKARDDAGQFLQNEIHLLGRIVP